MAAKTLKRVPKEYRLRILEVLKEPKTILCHTRTMIQKKLKGFEDTFRICIGNLRIVYTIDWSSRIITVDFIGPRGHAYK